MVSWRLRLPPIEMGVFSQCELEFEVHGKLLEVFQFEVIQSESIEDEEVSLVDGVLEGALGALGDEIESLGFRNRGSSEGHGGLWWLMMNEEDGELVMCIWREFIGRRDLLKRE
ncbi:hypothetical protein Tco_0429798 [Tanacetum coccineum]